MLTRAKHPTTGKWYTRDEWEKSHKPTCSVYPCEAWMGIHWHMPKCKHHVIRAIRRCSYCDREENKEILATQLKEDR